MNLFRPGERVLVLGYGNPGRQDDGLGQELAQRIAAANWEGVDVEISYQLSIDDGLDASKYDLILFVDASLDGAEPFEIREIVAANGTAFSSHIVAPELVLAIARDCFGHEPRGVLIAIRGYEFELAEGISEPAIQNVRSAFEYLERSVSSESSMK